MFFPGRKSSRLRKNFLSQLPDLPLAGPQIFESAELDVLIGAHILPLALLSGTKTNIYGFSAQISHAYDSSLDTLLMIFWEVEDLPIKLVKNADFVCEDNFLRTSTRDENGRYIVTLPFPEPERVRPIPKKRATFKKRRSAETLVRLSDPKLSRS